MDEHIGISAYKVMYSLLVNVILFPIKSESIKIPEFITTGYCSTPDLPADFDPIKYQGIWFDILRVPNDYMAAQNCILQNYTFIEEGDTPFIEVRLKGISTEDVKVGQNAILRPYDYSDGASKADMLVESTGVPSAPYQVVATDYKNYACIYSCMGYWGMKAHFAWIFSRKPTLSKEFTNLCKDVLGKNGVTEESLVVINQGEECPYKEKLSQLLHYNKKLLKKVLKKSKNKIINTPELTTTTTTTSTSTTGKPDLHSSTFIPICPHANNSKRISPPKVFIILIPVLLFNYYK